jgi:cytochrome c553
MHQPRLLLPGVLFLVLTAPLAAEPPQTPLPPDHAERLARGTELFTRHVRKLLADRCLRCHGEPKVKGDLDLSSRELLLKGGQNGAAVVPFDAKKSRLLALVRHQEEPHMPSNAPRLADEAVQHLAAWIDLGAPYDKPLVAKAVTGVKKPMVVTDEDRRFWSFLPLRRPEPPQVKDAAWVQTPVDRFILAKLEGNKLRPNGPADRRTLIRRAYLDLIGLPPTPEEVEAFVNDRSASAWGKLIDRLLANPHHGERWARHWLDVARFAESHGFEHDYDRPNAYHYRDFVIKALNQDLPYDTFVKWQLAGDEYEPDNPLALAATGFLAAGVHSTQITISQVEKERYDELDDMARTTGTAMLGLTVGCARCHDHKFDPLPTKDYYRMVATFTTTVRSDYDVDLDPAATRRARAAFDAEHATLLATQQKFEQEQLPARFDRWLASRKPGTPSPRWLTVEPESVKSHGGATFTRLDDGSQLAGGTSPDFDTYTVVVRTKLKGITAIRLEALADPSMAKGGPGRAANGNIALTEFRLAAAPLATPDRPTPVKLVNAKATFEQKGLPVAAAIDADPKSAWALDPQFGKDHAAVFEMEKDAGFDKGTVLTFVLEFKNNHKHCIGRFRLALSTSPRPAALDGAAMPAEVVELLATPEPKFSASQRELLLKWYRTQDADWRALDEKVRAHAAAPKPKTTKMLISSEGVPAVRLHTQGGDFLPVTHFLNRGDPNQKGDVVQPGFLQVVTRSAEGEGRWKQSPPAGCRTTYHRRNLAEWITDVDHGAGHLLARVIVNRLWQHHLGRGLVNTPSDFGFQGERPLHSELLDFLASELVRGGWRLKPIHKLIMLSSVYQQSTTADPEKVKADPDNRRFGRRVRQRLEAEVIRDAMLAAGGLLDEKMFGPGTLDPNMKRRSIYFFVKRSKLVPSMVVFDAPDALQSLDRRPTTTVAPQALLVMNAPQVRGCAEGLAKRMDAPGRSFEESVKAGYAVALSRPPMPEELADAAEFLKQQAESYTASGKADARQRALTDFAQVLLGLNEFIYIE